MNTFRLRCAAFAILLFSIPCSAASPKLAPELAGLDPASFVNVIVQFTAAPNESHAARIRALGGTPKVDLSVIHAAATTPWAPTGGTISSPGNSPHVITVGAMKDMSNISRTDDLIASYSSKGPTLLDQIVKPDLVAPGNNIVSAMSSGSLLPQLYPANVVPMTYYKSNGGANADSSYMRLSGTSMAAPMVSGAAVLLLQQNPSRTPDQVKARLMKTATEEFSIHQRRHQSGNRRDLYKHVRPLYGRSRLPGCVGGVE